MKVALLAVLIAVAIFPVAGAKQFSSFRAHVEANASNGPVFSDQLNLFGRTVTLEKIPSLSEQDVTRFQSYRAKDGSYGVLFELNPHGQLALDTVSVEHRGRSLFIFVNSRPITELQIDRRITDGKIYIPAGLTANDIMLLNQDWPTRSRK
ncbi:MAG: hypothetical protein ACJ8M4_06520 [Chthoniobacterales bacterium]